MPVFRGSRYETSKYTGIVGKDLLTRKYVHDRTPLKFEKIDPSWVQHIFVEGETLDSIVYDYTENAGKAKLWWMVADVNNILWPLDIEPGTKIIIPVQLLGRS